MRLDEIRRIVQLEPADFCDRTFSGNTGETPGRATVRKSNPNVGSQRRCFMVPAIPAVIPRAGQIHLPCFQNRLTISVWRPKDSFFRANVVNMVTGLLMNSPARSACPRVFPCRSILAPETNVFCSCRGTPNRAGFSVWFQISEMGHIRQSLRRSSEKQFSAPARIYADLDNCGLHPPMRMRNRRFLVTSRGC
jgi:hypothetical protein